MMASQPFTILIGALGGEGGGVLADWLTRIAESAGFPVQRTSIPGVAQRTGATTYYLELIPESRGFETDDWVLALSPVPGQIDLFVASELLEAGRAVQSGLISPERTTVVASNHRVFTVTEKAAMGDGRYSAQRLHNAVARFAKRVATFDMEAAARASGAAISAVMLGGIAASGVLPLGRKAFEDAIRASGTGVESSLRGFAAGFDAASVPAAAVTATPATNDDKVHAISGLAGAIDPEIPRDVRTLLEQGYARQLDYQNRKYAERYLERVMRVYTQERVGHGAAEYPVTAAVARFLALWMAYEDVIRVGDLKSRQARLRRIRSEIDAQPNEPVRIMEYLKPGIDEWCAILPTPIADRLRRWAERRRRRLNIGLHVRTTSLHGFLLLRLLASLRWWRPYTSRYAEEQQLIETWLEQIMFALPRDRALALEIALCARLIKGYGDTHTRGKTNFRAILNIACESGAGTDSRAATVRAAREAALADPEGRKLEETLGAHGVTYVRPAAAPAPIVWHKSARGAARR
jgi:indolepyruvate ferredoxin oxidoreductase, beta subunit